MKILYLDVLLHSINPSNTYFANLINKIGDVEYFGPSFVSKKIIDNGLIKFIEKKGPFDFLIIGPNTPLFLSKESVDNHAKYILKYTNFYGSKSMITRYLEDLFNNLSNIPIKNKIYSMFLIDHYAITEDQLRVFKEHDFYLLTPNEYFFPYLKNLPSWIKNEHFYKRKKYKLEDTWKNFLKNNEGRVISCIHYIAESEFIYRDLDSRNFDVVVPGIMYTKRALIKKILQQSKFTIYKNLISFLIRALNAIRINVFSDYIFINIYNLSFKKSLINSKFAYTDGGGFNFAVRKFFEIPASGCLLFCREPYGFKDLGYKSDVHFIDADEQNILQKLNYYKKNIRQAKLIANNGLKLTITNHSLMARAEQIKKCLISIKDGNFHGSKWQNGKYIINTKQQS